MPVKCKICSTNTRIIKHPKDESLYYVCPECQFISLDEGLYLKEVDEIRRYGNHKNSMEDSGYVAYFRSFINSTILNFQGKCRFGLDFGSGPEPVLGKLLEQDYGYEMDIYDKYFSPDKVYEGKSYGLITSTEVVEHLDDPLSYFALFKRLMKADATLAIMTQFHPVDDDKFFKWHYRRDPSHISFYTPKTMIKIAELIGLDIVFMDSHKNIAFKKKSEIFSKIETL